MAKRFSLEILTPSSQFYQGSVELVVVNTTSGAEGFMADHAWAIKLLKEGKMKILEAGHEMGDFRYANIKDGFIDVRDNIIIYTDDAEWEL